MKKLLLLMLLTSLSLFTVFGAGQKEQAGESEGETGELKPVVLEMYLLGDPQPDYEKMLVVLNEKLKEDINATLKVNFTTWSGWDTKYNLLLTAGEKFDLIFAAQWTKYQEFARQGAYLELNELLPKYAPETWNNVPKDGWEQTKVDGNIYMVPMNALEFETHGLLYRLDLAKKYGIGKIENVDDMEAYFNAIKENEKGMIPLNAGAQGPGNNIRHFINAIEGVRPYPWDDSVNMMFHRYLDEEKWFFPLERHGEVFYEKTREFYEKGFWPKNILSSQMSARDNLKSGTSASAILNAPNANDDSIQILTSHPEWELDWFNFEHRSPVNKTRALIGNGMAINDNAKNPERALMFLDLVHNDFEYYMLLTNGIRGEHWELDDDGNMVMPDGVDASNTGFAWDAPCPWGWREEKFHLGGIMKNPRTMSFIKEWWSKWVEDSVFNTSVDFAFDPTPVAAEMAALSNVQSSYELALQWGVLELEKIDEYEEALKKAGLEKVKAELNKQWNEYLKAK